MIVLRVLVALGLAAAGAACGDGAASTGPAAGRRGTFEPAWSDEFDGSSIDPSKWYVLDEHQDAWPETPWRRNWKRENAYLEDGALVLRTVREGDAFSTGAVRTASPGEPTLFEQAFGRFEAKVRFPRQQGHWCAFWLMNVREGNLDGSGRDGTEIDVMEKAWLVDQAQHTLHWDGYGPAHGTAEKVVKGLGLDDGGWHVVRLDWYPDEYVFFVDGRETWRTDAGGVCQTPGYVKLTDEIGNFGVGPGQWGVGPIADADLPDYFYVDYVRVSRYVPPS
jgi:beta-glucanase (GH16 family)